jgi:hypothetical protein
MSVNRLNELNRHRTKSGPGRMPFRRTSLLGSKRMKLATGPGSIGCEREILRVARTSLVWAVNLYEKHRDTYMHEGKMQIDPMMQLWYARAKQELGA